MIPNYAHPEALKTFIERALQEDIQHGDHSSLATIDPKKQQKAQLLVKDDCVLAGVVLAETIFKQFDPNLQIETFIHDGQSAKKGDVAFVVSGSALSILSTERLVLNCMQRMSGIATITQQWMQELAGTHCQLLDTRKTTPNFRICEKWAVQIGGGTNHRFGLYDMVMLKDNHVDFNGSITNAVNMTVAYLQKNKLDLKIEVETRNLAEVQEALTLPAVYRIMLDNMSLDEMAQAVKLINEKCQVEASGGVQKAQLKGIAQTGVDFISAGAIIHSAQNMDLSLKAVK
jgi:nicotinate-nucleotide pyrophosphorylase (carboxylating)